MQTYIDESQKLLTQFSAEWDYLIQDADKNGLISEWNPKHGASPESIERLFASYTKDWPGRLGDLDRISYACWIDLRNIVTVLAELKIAYKKAQKHRVEPPTPRVSGGPL